jgi:hypothetical protein
MLQYLKKEHVMCELLRRFIRACQNDNFKHGLFRNFAQIAFSESEIVWQYERYLVLLLYFLVACHLAGCLSVVTHVRRCCLNLWNLHCESCWFLPMFGVGASTCGIWNARPSEWDRVMLCSDGSIKKLFKRPRFFFVSCKLWIPSCTFGCYAANFLLRRHVFRALVFISTPQNYLIRSRRPS